MKQSLNNQVRKIISKMTLAGMTLSLCFGMSGPRPALAQGKWTEAPTGTEVTQESSTIPSESSFTLDGVLVTLQASSLPSMNFIVSEPGSAIQVATSATLNPFREVTVEAIPFGSTPGTEALPIAGAGLKPTYDSALRNYRISQGGSVQDGSTITLFGQQITGSRSLVNLFIDGPVQKHVVIDEWVAEAGERLWIIRWSEEVSTSDLSALSGSSSGDLALESSSLNNPTTVNDQPAQNPGLAPGQDGMAGMAATPSWWHGDCDYTTYYQGSGGIGSYRLSAVYLGIPACGPRPSYDAAPDVLIHFFSGAWGEFEWECVEYSMRFLYLMYGIHPYHANGSQVVWNYPGSELLKIGNGVAGYAPVPGDVLSYGSTSTFGHTSVVTASNIDGNGNGTITVIEENNTVSGSSNLIVRNWSVAGNAGSVSGWLHLRTANLNGIVRDDYDGDGKTDPAKFIASAGSVWWLKSTTDLWDGKWLGSDTFTCVGASDFDGDGKTDPAKFYPATGTVWWVKSSTGTLTGQWLGGDSFQYVSGSDFDGDGKTDPAKFYPATGTVWWVKSTTHTIDGMWLGPDTFTYVPASDFDGDGKTDPGKFYPATGTVWWVKSSTHTLDGAWLGPGTFTYVAGCDFDGDGKTDPAKFDSSTHILSWLNTGTGTWTDVDMGTGTYTLANGQ